MIYLIIYILGFFIIAFLDGKYSSTEEGSVFICLVWPIFLILLLHVHIRQLGQKYSK